MDGKRVALEPGKTRLDLGKIYPDALVKGRDGEKWATLEFDIVAPCDGEFPLEMHNDYYGELSVNGGDAVATEGPWRGFEVRPITLHKGVNHIRFRTRAGSGGRWTTGFRLPSGSGASFMFRNS